MIAPGGTRLLAIAVAITAGVSGCFGLPVPFGQQQSDYQKKLIKQFEKAAFSISGGDIFVRSDDTNPWQGVNITLDTDHGYFRQAAGDMEPGQVREFALKSFVDQSGNAFGPDNRLKSVWVQARYPDGGRVNEMAFPAETFGYQSAVPPGG